MVGSAGSPAVPSLQPLPIVPRAGSLPWVLPQPGSYRWHLRGRAWGRGPFISGRRWAVGLHVLPCKRVAGMRTGAWLPGSPSAAAQCVAGEARAPARVAWVGQEASPGGGCGTRELMSTSQRHEGVSPLGEARVPWALVWHTLWGL